MEPGEGTEVPPESVVTLVVSKGRAPVPVPQVVGSTFDVANAALTGAGFTVTRSDEFSDTVPAGAVIATNPPVGNEAPYGSAVAVVVSRGPDLVTVPDVRGNTLGTAIDLLQAAGLSGEVDGPILPGQPVATQSPEPNAQLKRGSTVTLTLAGGGGGGAVAMAMATAAPAGAAARIEPGGARLRTMQPA